MNHNESFLSLNTPEPNNQPNKSHPFSSQSGVFKFFLNKEDSDTHSDSGWEISCPMRRQASILNKGTWENHWSAEPRRRCHRCWRSNSPHYFGKCRTRSSSTGCPDTSLSLFSTVIMIMIISCMHFLELSLGMHRVSAFCRFHHALSSGWWMLRPKRD